MNRSLISGGVAVLFTLGAAPLSYGSISSMNPLHPQRYHGINYISGGVGSDERSALRNKATDDNLELSFAARDKDYLGGAEVSVMNAKGEDILRANSDGPLFYAKLPQGEYTVSATVDGKTITRKVRVGKKGRQIVYFTWNEPDRGVAANHKVGSVAYSK